MRPFEEVCEIDESWEFSKLKTEMQEIVSKLYAYKANNWIIINLLYSMPRELILI